MLLNPQALSVAKFASRDTTRPTLQNIKIDPDGTVWATDGHTAIKAIPIGETPDPDSFPDVPGVPADAYAPTCPVLVPAATALAAMKGAAHKGNPWPFVSVVCARNGVCSAAAGGGVTYDETAYIVTTDGTTHNVTPVLQENGDPATNYPDVTAVWPNGAVEEGANESSFDAGKLAALAALAKSHNRSPESAAVAVTLRGPTKAASLSWTLDGCIQFDAILMPKRLAP